MKGCKRTVITVTFTRAKEMVICRAISKGGTLQGAVLLHTFKAACDVVEIAVAMSEWLSQLVP